MLTRERLEAAGFFPDWNVCRGCHHKGGERNIHNRCLSCSCACFTSMTEDEKWAYALAALDSQEGKE